MTATERVPTEAPTETLNKTWMLVPMWKLEAPNGLTEEDCADRFEQKYGHPPEFIFEWHRDLWMGPIETLTKTY